MTSTYYTHNFIEMWNTIFPNDIITAADLKQTLSVVNCLLLILKRLDIDPDVLVKPPAEEERTENTIYYWDLIPIINLTKIIIYIVKPQETLQTEVTLSCLLHPTQQTSYPILMYLFNYMLFIEQQIEAIKPYEDEILEKLEKISNLGDFNKEVIQHMNNHALEKSKRAERMQMMEKELVLLEEESKREKAARDAEIIEFEQIAVERQKVKKITDQITSQRDTILTDIEKCKSQIVLDAEDIKEQDKHLVQDIKDVEKFINTQSDALMQKDSRKKILQSIKQIFDIANDCLQNIVENLKECDNSNFDLDSKESELMMLTNDLSDLMSQHSELLSAREEVRKRRQDAIEKRQQTKATAERELHIQNKKLNEQKEKAQKDIPLIKKIEEELIEGEKCETLYQKQPADITEELIRQITLLSEESMEALKKFGEIIKQKFN